MRWRRLSVDSTLTAWEDAGLQRAFNLADGHAHQKLSAVQITDLGDLTHTLTSIESKSQRDRELDLLDAFNSVSGQSAEAESAFLHYSCSVSIDLVSRLLREKSIRRVALITPTFDNIPLLLRRHGCQLLPIDSRIWASDEYRKRALAACDALFLVCPNNPTGFLPLREHFELLLADASAAGCLVIVDFSFRLYTDWHTFDQYEIARRIPNLRFIFLEDSGKVYPAAELKVGIANVSRGIVDELEQITDELLLNVSPMVLYSVASLMWSDRRSAGLSSDRVLEAARIVSINRKLLRVALSGFPVSVESQSSHISVEWVKLRHPASTEITERMGEWGLAILPGPPFTWNDPHEGQRYVRIALARDPVYFADAMGELQRGLARLGDLGLL
jgi:aspartate/methionine/tyrosine aminotransferase